MQLDTGAASDTLLTFSDLVAVQIVATIAYVGATFLLYRLLVSQKDATIETLKEHNVLLRSRLDSAEAQGPDALVERLSARIDKLTSELRRLGEDHDKNSASIQQKELALQSLVLERTRLREQLERAQEVLGDLTCPICGSTIAERTFVSESVEYNGRDVDVDHEFVSYECGLAFVDGKETSPCSATK